MPRARSVNRNRSWGSLPVRCVANWRKLPPLGSCLYRGDRSCSARAPANQLPALFSAGARNAAERRAPIAPAATCLFASCCPLQRSQSTRKRRGRGRGRSAGCPNKQSGAGAGVAFETGHGCVQAGINCEAGSVVRRRAWLIAPSVAESARWPISGCSRCPMLLRPVIYYAHGPSAISVVSWAAIFS